MKSSRIPATQINNVQMPEAVRAAVEVAVTIVWVEAQKMAHNDAEAASRLEAAAAKNRIDEMAAANAAQAETILDLRENLADHVVKDDAARDEAAMAARQLGAMTEKAARVEVLAEKTAVQMENLKKRWQSIRTLFAEIDAEIPEPGVQHEFLDVCPPKEETEIQPRVVAKAVCATGDDRCQREEADCIAAAIVLLKAAAGYRRHTYRVSGGKNEPLNELRGSKSEDTLAPEISPEPLLQRQKPRKGKCESAEIRPSNSEGNG